MAQGVIWSQESLEDIQALAAFIGRDSAFHARRVVEEIFDIGESIPEQPLLGRMVPELQDSGLRERFLYSYRIIYQISAQEIEILAVIHGRRLLESVGQRFE